MVLFPNAKINIGLNIIKKRDDGFHNIESVFVPIGLYDILEFIPANDNTFKITVTGIKLNSNPDNNLVAQAWHILHNRFNIPPVHIHLHKIIPAGAGLGGGSADAAFILTGLNKYFQCGCSNNELENIAAELGSDCAFFIKNKTAIASGRGEILKPIDINLSLYEILLVNPGIHVSTREAYSGIAPKEPSHPLSKIIYTPIKTWHNSIANDFENTVFKLHPKIQALKQQMSDSGALYSAMSGSGSTVFGIFNKGTLDKKNPEFKNCFTSRCSIL